MAVQSTLSIVYKALPIRINEDASVSVTIRMGFEDEGTFHLLDTKQVSLDTSEALALLQAPPAVGKNRWDDLSDALYEHLISKGYISGEIL